jgi:hypothetical protein
MAGRDSAKYPRNANARRCGVVVGGALSAFVAAAAMATGSAAPAKADFEDLLDPIIQPLLTSLTDSVAAFDPSAAVDLTSWTDSLLSSLGATDVAVPSAAEPAAAVAAAASPASDITAPTPADIPITIAENTEPTVQGSIDGGADVPLLVDTGSSGLVIPYTDLGSSASDSFEKLLELGFPVGSGLSGFTGGNAPEYFYLTYDTTVDYQTADGTLATENIPVEVEVFSVPTVDSDSSYFAELFDNSALQDFLGSNDVSGILGVGDGASGGAGESPIEAAGYTGVTIDLPAKELIVGNSNPFTPIDTLANSGATPTSDLTETVKDGNTLVGTHSVSDDIDSGGVYGTILESIAPNGVPDGDTITVSDGNTVLYSYTVENDGGNQLPNETPTVVSGSSIDSGYAAFENNPVYLDYAAHTLSFDQ